MLFTKPWSLFGIVLVSLLLSACGGGGGSDSGNPSGNSGGITDINPPQNDGFSLLAATGRETVSAAWMPASDDATPTDKIVYELHYGTTENFSVSSSTLYDEYLGDTSTELTGLSPNTEYFFKIIAIDEAGNKAEASDSPSVKTASTDPTRTSVEVNESQNLHLGTPEIIGPNNSIYVFQRSATSQAPQVGSVLVGEDKDGNGYLRKVDSVNETASELTVETSAVSLNEVFENVELSSTVSLNPVDIDATNNNHSLSRSMGSSSYSGNTKKLYWDNHLLEASEVFFSDSDSSGNRLNKSLGATETNISINASAGHSLTLTGDLDFSPTVYGEAHITGFMLNRARIDAKGSLTANLTLAYKADGGASVNVTKQIVERSYRSVIPVSGIPVYQVVTLKVSAEFTGRLESELSAETKAQASAVVNITSTYDGANWHTSSSEGFDKSLTLSAEGHGSGFAEVRLIPEIEVSYYSALTGTISVEPYTNATVEAEAIMEHDLIDNGFSLAYGFTRFDAFIGADVNFIADLTIFDENIARYPDEGKKNLYNAQEQLFGLPELQAAAVPNSDDSLRLVATSKPFTSNLGANNRFDTDSAQWAIFPQVDVLPGMEAEWRGNEEPGKIYFMGHSEMLGEIGRQFVEISTNTVIEEITSTGSYTGLGRDNQHGESIVELPKFYIEGARLIDVEVSVNYFGVSSHNILAVTQLYHMNSDTGGHSGVFFAEASSLESDGSFNRVVDPEVCRFEGSGNHACWNGSPLVLLQGTEPGETVDVIISHGAHARNETLGEALSQKTLDITATWTITYHYTF